MDVNIECTSRTGKSGKERNKKSEVTKKAAKPRVRKPKSEHLKIKNNRPKAKGKQNTTKKQKQDKSVQEVINGETDGKPIKYGAKYLTPSDLVDLANEVALNQLQTPKSNEAASKQVKKGRKGIKAKAKVPLDAIVNKLPTPEKQSNLRMPGRLQTSRTRKVHILDASEICQVEMASSSNNSDTPGSLCPKSKKSRYKKQKNASTPSVNGESLTEIPSTLIAEVQAAGADPVKSQNVEEIHPPPTRRGRPKKCQTRINTSKNKLQTVKPKASVSVKQRPKRNAKPTVATDQIHSDQVPNNDSSEYKETNTSVGHKSPTLAYNLTENIETNSQSKDYMQALDDLRNLTKISFENSQDAKSVSGSRKTSISNASFKSDSFTWAGDISSSCPTSSTEFRCIDGKLPKLELVNIMAQSTYRISSQNSVKSVSPLVDKSQKISPVKRSVKRKLAVDTITSAKKPKCTDEDDMIFRLDTVNKQLLPSPAKTDNHSNIEIHKSHDTADRVSSQSIVNSVSPLVENHQRISPIKKTVKRKLAVDTIASVKKVNKQSIPSPEKTDNHPNKESKKSHDTDDGSEGKNIAAVESSVSEKVSLRKPGLKRQAALKSKLNGDLKATAKKALQRTSVYPTKKVKSYVPAPKLNRRVPPRCNSRNNSVVSKSSDTSILSTSILNRVKGDGYKSIFESKTVNSVAKTNIRPSSSVIKTSTPIVNDSNKSHKDINHSNLSETSSTESSTSESGPSSSTSSSTDKDGEIRAEDENKETVSPSPKNLINFSNKFLENTDFRPKTIHCNKIIRNMLTKALMLEADAMKSILKIRIRLRNYKSFYDIDEDSVSNDESKCGIESSDINRPKASPAKSVAQVEFETHKLQEPINSDVEEGEIQDDDDCINNDTPLENCDDDVLSLFAESITGMESLNKTRMSETISKSSKGNTRNKFNNDRPLNEHYCEAQKRDQIAPKPNVVAKYDHPKSNTIDLKALPQYEHPAASDVHKFKKPNLKNLKSVHLEDHHAQPENQFRKPEVSIDQQMAASNISVDEGLLPDESNFINYSNSIVFKGCIYYMARECKKGAQCRYPHVKLEKDTVISNLANIKTEQSFLFEFRVLKAFKYLLKKFITNFVDACVEKKFIRMLLHMSQDPVSLPKELKTYVLENTLLQLNGRQLSAYASYLNKENSRGQILCETLMMTISNTQNFSRFKSVFVNLTKFITERGRRFLLDVAERILAFLSILRYEEALAECMITIALKTDTSIFSHAMASRFEDMLKASNRDQYERYMHCKKMALVNINNSYTNTTAYKSQETALSDSLHNQPPLLRTISYNPTPNISPQHSNPSPLKDSPISHPIRPNDFRPHFASPGQNVTYGVPPPSFRVPNPVHLQRMSLIRPTRFSAHGPRHFSDQRRHAPPVNMPWKYTNPNQFPTNQQHPSNYYKIQGHNFK